VPAKSGGSCCPPSAQCGRHRFGAPDEGSGRGWVKPATAAVPAGPLRLPTELRSVPVSTGREAGTPDAAALAAPVCDDPCRPETAPRTGPEEWQGSTADDPGLATPQWRGGPVEFDRVVPASGNMQVAGRKFWLGPARAGVVVTVWADVDVIHLLIGGARVKTVRSHLSVNDLAALASNGGRPAGPPPLPPGRGRRGAGGGSHRRKERDIVTGPPRQLLAAEILGGRRVGICIDGQTLLFFDPDTRELLRTRPNPLTFDQARRLRGARPAGPPPRPSIEPIRVQRRASNTGVIMVAGQKIALGRIHAGHTVSVHVADTTMTIDFGDDTRTVQRTTTQPVRSIKGQRPRKVAQVG